MRPTLRLHGVLAQEDLAPAKLPVQLVVKVISVCQHHNGGAVQHVLQPLGEKHHGKGFAATLRMPENPRLAVCLGGIIGGLQSLFHRKILMIARQHLVVSDALMGEAEEIFQDVQKAFFGKNALEKGVKLGVLRVFVAAVLGLPLHEAVFARCDGAGLGDKLIAHDAQGVVDKERRYVVHIVPQLAVRFGNISIFPHGGF